MNEAKLNIYQLGIPQGGCGCSGMSGAYKDAHGTTLAGDVLRWFVKDNGGNLRQVAGTAGELLYLVNAGKQIFTGTSKNGVIPVSKEQIVQASNSSGGNNDVMMANLISTMMQSNQALQQQMIESQRREEERRRQERDREKNKTLLFVGIGGGLILLMFMMMSMNKK